VIQNDDFQLRLDDEPTEKPKPSIQVAVRRVSSATHAEYEDVPGENTVVKVLNESQTWRDDRVRYKARFQDGHSETVSTESFHWAVATHLRDLVLYNSNPL
jgi:hypothetical protein